MTLPKLSQGLLVVCVLGASLVAARFLLAEDGPVVRRFRQLDSSGDSRLDPSELTDAGLFEKLDTDDDGFVSLTEGRKAFAAGVLTREQVDETPSLTPQPDPISSGAGPTAVAGAGARGKVKVLRPADHGVGRYVADTTFADLHGRMVSLSEFKGRSFTVVAMTSTSCPLSRKFLPTLAELAQQYGSRGVQFVAVNCVPTDRAEQMAAAAKTLGESVIYVHNVNDQLAGHLGAVSTTDVLVLDSARTVVYHGAIDDQYGIGYALEAPRQRFLAEALDALLEGKSLRVAATEASGCVLEIELAAEETTVTYHNRISRILQANCIECHRTGGVGPFPLDTYADVSAHAPMVRQVVDSSTMPPWFAENAPASHVKWSNDRSLSGGDRDDLLAWLSGPRTEGDPADAPLPRQFADGWTIGVPDLIVQIPEPISIKATGTMPYKFVTTQTTLDKDQWVQGYEIVPTDRSVVHHVLVNVHEKGTERIRDREEGIGGYWAAYVPGNAGQMYPEGFARKLPAGATVSFQIHYTPNGEVAEDQLKLGLFFAKSEPRYVVTTIPLADPDLNIPPHSSDHAETIVRPVPRDIHVMAYMAHMHVRGKSFLMELMTADGGTETLLSIPQYDFNWQLRYEYAEPKTLPAGSRVKVTAVFDNSEDNPANPDPSKTVHWGQQTFDEMMIGYVESFAPVGEERPGLRAASGGGVGAVMFTLLDADGDGLLSKEEAKRASARVPRLRDKPEIPDRIFEQVDTDHNGQLSPEEFESLREQLGARR